MEFVEHIFYINYISFYLFYFQIFSNYIGSYTNFILKKMPVKPQSIDMTVMTLTPIIVALLFQIMPKFT